MADKFPAFPAFPQHGYTMALDQVQYKFEFTYRPRTEAWYVNISDADGNALASGRKLSVGWGPILGLILEKQPSGILYVRGPVEYTQEQWGTELELLRILQSELAAVAVDEGDLSVVII